MWLPPALLLLCLPGCLSLTGPGSVNGILGSSLSLQCQYEEAYKGYNKYWCRGQYDTECHSIVETKGGEKEERNGRVSIRDSADDLTLTVTIENLSEDDAGSYWCKIQTIWILDIWSRDPSVPVEVYVSPATPTPRETTVPATTPTLQRADPSIEEAAAQYPWSLLSSVHFLLLIFLKVPLFLSMLSAVLWVNRPQQGPGGRQRQLVQDLCSPPPQECPLRGRSSFRL
ncbi:CMRF35-like molecule 2 isoform X2 [Sciurus carolinensis]|uniref:CMRF35-like molecule 2 isoform X2 n=1 Tax=Sciurus carolinensis TaxID=30640 RepID=UPI001FB49C08|nr:CMRF35-like molecule 2 isoform X2 [Sciurus carolinensis]